MAMNYLTAKDVLSIFKIHRRTLNNWMSNKGMPYTKIGQTLRFEESELKAWVKANNEQVK